VLVPESKTLSNMLDSLEQAVPVYKNTSSSPAPEMWV